MTSLISEKGKTHTKPEDILQEGRKFYMNLYQNREESLLPMTEVEEKLAQLTVPQIAESDKEAQEAPFGEEELHKH